MKMIKQKLSKQRVIVTLFFFICFTFVNHVSFAKDEDILAKAKMLIQQGNLDRAIEELYQVIKKLKAIVSQKKKLAEAHYLLARVYKIAQMENECKINLKKAFEVFPTFTIDEPDPGLIELVKQVKAEIEKEKVIPEEGSPRKKKKKFPLLMVLGGAAAVITVVLLLGKKGSSDDSSNYDTNTLGIQWINIPAGDFLMGDNFNDQHSWVDEQPVHTVYLDDYRISKFEITFEQYDIFCDDTGRNKPGDDGWGRGDRPVINISWNDAREFCSWISRKAGKDIRLPTEAQWEKAARGTDQRKYPWGNDPPTCELTNYNRCENRTMPVGSKPLGASPYGIQDMAGNVWEWCFDWYNDSYYSISPSTNPTGPDNGAQKVLRGGTWTSTAENLRTVNRDGTFPDSSSNHIGFRICWN
jgi:formylglycine-generating enzyme required for sulfatase activity